MKVYDLEDQCPACRGVEGDRRSSYCVCPPGPAPDRRTEVPIGSLHRRCRACGKKIKPISDRDAMMLVETASGETFFECGPCFSVDGLGAGDE